VPTLVREEATTFAASVVPVRDPAGAAPVILPAMAFVTVRSVKKPAVSLAPVAPSEPVEVMLFEPMARVPPMVKAPVELNEDVAVAPKYPKPALIPVEDA